MTRMLAAAALFLVACGGPAAASPPPDAARVLAAAERADDALRAGYAGGDTAPLQETMAGRALTVARRQIAQFARGGIHREEQLDGRREVHESAAGGHAEVVLLISARQRLVRPGAPVPAFSKVLRQWRATLALQNGRWVVVDDGDLPPAQWWPS